MGLGRVIPTRKYKNGPKPGLSNPEITTRKLSHQGGRKLKKEIKEGTKKKKGKLA